MAAPITHIILAIQILSLLPNHFDKKEFLVGTSFPDIRYFAKIDRKVTHIEPVSWHDVISAKSAFHAGMLFHNLVDILRIMHFEPEFYDRSKAQEYDPTFVLLFPLAMKKAEDVLLYDFAINWQEIIECFDTIYPEELALGKNEATVKKWHSMLQNYFQERPNTNTIQTLLVNINQREMPSEHKGIVSNYLDKLTHDALFKDKIEAFYHNFRKYLPRDAVTTPYIS